MMTLDALCLELSILVLLVSAALIRRLRDPYAARKWSVVASGIALIGVSLAWLPHFGDHAGVSAGKTSLFAALLGRPIFEIDRLSAPLLVMAGLLSFLTFLSTHRTKLRWSLFEMALVSEALLLATLGARAPWAVIVFLAASTLPPFLELRIRRRPVGVYAVHMGAFVALLLAGQSLVEFSPAGSGTAAAGLFLLGLGVLIRSGIAPLHCWVSDLFEHATFGTAMQYLLPLTGTYAAVRLLVPAASPAMLQFISVAALVTAVYAGGMALVQREARRFFGFLMLSLSAQVLAGLDSRTMTGLTGALCTWLSVSLSLGGFGLMLRALEARFERLSLAMFHGYYEHTPTLAVCFMLTGLAAIGFPGTIGFVGTEMLIDGAVERQPVAAVAFIIASTLCGIAALRGYFLLFTGTRHVSDVWLRIRIRERIAVLALTALLIGGGLWSQPWIASRHRAAEQLRAARTVAESADGRSRRSTAAVDRHEAVAPAGESL